LNIIDILVKKDPDGRGLPHNGLGLNLSATVAFNIPIIINATIPPHSCSAVLIAQEATLDKISLKYQHTAGTRAAYKLEILSKTFFDN
jgi:hypothetical protein